MHGSSNKSPTKLICSGK